MLEPHEKAPPEAGAILHAVRGVPRGGQCRSAHLVVLPQLGAPLLVPGRHSWSLASMTFPLVSVMKRATQNASLLVNAQAAFSCPLYRFPSFQLSVNEAQGPALLRVCRLVHARIHTNGTSVPVWAKLFLHNIQWHTGRCLWTSTPGPHLTIACDARAARAVHALCATGAEARLHSG